MRKLALLAALVLVVAGVLVRVAPHRSDAAAPALAASPAPTMADAVPTAPHPASVVSTFHGCPPQGSGAQIDEDLDRMKNRTDAVADDAWNPVTLDAIINLPMPDGTTKFVKHWPAAAKAAVAPFLGVPVRTEGFLIAAAAQAGEDTNCDLHTPAAAIPNANDFHLSLAASDSDGLDKAMVVEVTPRVRASHPTWTIERFGELVAGEAPVRISGWLFLDTKHQNLVGKTRATRWEIHPVLRVEVLTCGEWVDLDNLPAAGATPAPCG